MDFDKVLKRNINDVKRGIKNLSKLGLKIELVETETMLAHTVTHCYVVDYVGDRIILQKHLFTVN